MTNTIPNVPRDFKKRPVIIQAIKWTGDNLFDVIKFMSGAPSIQTDIGAAKWNEYCDLVQDSGLIIKTLEGQHIATVGDMIIRGVKGEFYPCKPDIFDMTYELSAPSPAGVDGLEVVAVVKDCAHLIGDESDEISAYLPVGTNLYSLPVDAQAIIDGLRGEVARLREERDSFQRIGIRQIEHRYQLAALLRGKFPRIDPHHPITLSEVDHCCEYVLHKDRERLHCAIDAALSAGKEGE